MTDENYLSNNKEHVKLYHENLANSLRHTEESTYKLVFSFISAGVIPILPYLLNKEKLSNLSITITAIIFGIFILWWTAYFIITSSYQYRNLQKGISKVQEYVGLYNEDVIDEKWKTNKSTNLIPEFYKSFYYSSIIGIIFLGFGSIILLLNQFNICNQTLLSNVTTCLGFNIMVIVWSCFIFIAIISLFAIKRSYQKKISEKF